MARVKKKDICIFIPALNEASSIGKVIDGFHDEGYNNILVVDGNSADNTVDIATSHGARVVTQSGRGKGQAIRQAFAEEISSDYVVMIDADLTYLPSEVDRAGTRPE